MPPLARLRADAAEAFGLAGRAEPADGTHLAATAPRVHIPRLGDVPGDVDAAR